MLMCASFRDEKAPNTLINGIFGGFVGVILSFLPFSTVIGGAVAGYLEGGSRMDGVRVGAIAGLVAAIPLLSVLAVVSFFTPMVVVGQGGNIRVLAAAGFFLLFAGVYVFGFSILGGILGVYYREQVREK